MASARHQTTAIQRRRRRRPSTTLRGTSNSKAIRFFFKYSNNPPLQRLNNNNRPHRMLLRWVLWRVVHLAQHRANNNNNNLIIVIIKHRLHSNLNLRRLPLRPLRQPLLLLRLTVKIVSSQNRYNDYMNRFYTHTHTK